MLLSRGIPASYIFNKIKREFIFVILYIVIFNFLNNQYDLSFLAVPFSLPGVIGTAISIILAFRINQAYARWWEARMVWGEIVNESRTFTRQLLNFIQGKDESLVKSFQQTLAYRQIAWCYTLGRSLRQLDPLTDLKGFITEEQILELRKEQNIPNALLLLHGMDIQKAYKDGWISDIQQSRLDETISNLCNAMGKSERIKNTVFPVLYSRILHIFLYLFIFLLPLGLSEYAYWITAPTIIAIAAVFFLIEATSLHLQDPFENKPNDTPVTAIARNIEINIRQMLGEEELPDKMAPEKYYLM